MCEYGLVLKCVDADKNVYQRKGVYREEHFKQDRIGPEFVRLLKKRIQKLTVDRYSFFDEDEPMIAVEII